MPNPRTMLSALLSHALFGFFYRFDGWLARTDSIPLTWKTTDPWTAQSNGNAGNADTNSASPAGFMCCLMGKWKSNLIAPATYGDSVNRTTSQPNKNWIYQTMNKTHDTMSPEEQNIAIAEACGWKKMNWNGATVYGSPTHGFRVWKSKHQDSIMSYKGRVGERIPDYLNDLNACREFEEVLNSPKYMQFHAFNNYAATLCEMCKHEYNAIAATAAQRCEAFLKTIGKWVTE